MKLAEALMKRAECQVRIRELRERIVRNVRVQEGEHPCEDPHALLNELGSVIDQLEELIRRINMTNAHTTIEGIGTITEALARRDVLSAKAKALREIASTAGASYDRYSRSELRTVAIVNVAELQRQADAVSREWRDLDARIQHTNWLVDVQ